MVDVEALACDEGALMLFDAPLKSQALSEEAPGAEPVPLLLALAVEATSVLDESLPLIEAGELTDRFDDVSLADGIAGDAAELPLKPSDAKNALKPEGAAGVSADAEGVTAGGANGFDAECSIAAADAVAVDFSAAVSLGATAGRACEALAAADDDTGAS